MLTGNYFKNTSPNKDVLIDACTGSKVTLFDLKKKTAKVQHYLKAHSIAGQDKAAVLLNNSTDYVVTLLALFDTDITIVPINPRINEFKCGYLLKHSCASFLITSLGMLKKNAWINNCQCKIIILENILESPQFPSAAQPDTISPDNDEIKLILYTSGTTGNPKGVMLSRKAVEKKIVDLIALLHFDPSDSFFSFLPFSSGHGMIPGLLAPLLSGMRVYTSEFNPFIVPVFWELIEKNGINYFTSVPSVLSLLKNHSNVPKVKPAALKGIFCASDNLPSSLIEWYNDRLNITIQNCYGLTETVSWVAVTGAQDPFKGKAYYIGKSFNADIAAFDSNGKKLEAGTKGELKIKSPCNMLGYYDNKPETNVAFSGEYINTGDHGYVDSEGHVFMLGRKKNIIKRNGINIYPQEVDQIFLEHPEVAECATFGIEDEAHGEKLIVALAVRNDRLTAGDYMEFVRKKLPVYLLPDNIIFMDNLPKSENGKVLISEIKARYIKTE